MRVRLYWLAMLVAFSARAAAPPLSIVDVGIRQIEDGPPLPVDFVFVPGDIVYVSFHVSGFKMSPDQKIHLSYKVDSFDPGGIRIMKSVTGSVQSTLTFEDVNKKWKPKVNLSITIPPLAPSGNYRVAMQVADDLAKTTASKEVSYPVHGRDVAPSATLVIRNFHFYRSDQDPQPLAAPFYRPGDTVWARFDITGYKFGDGNKVDVYYGISVLAPSGKVLFSQSKAAVEQSESFYPKRYVPSSMNLSLQPNIRPGEYTIVMTVRDLVGDQTYETKEKFGIQ